MIDLGSTYAAHIPVQKLVMIFSYTDGQTSRWTDIQTPYKMNHPYTVAGRKVSTLFFYLSQNGVSLLCSDKLSQQ